MCKVNITDLDLNSESYRCQVYGLRYNNLYSFYLKFTYSLLGRIFLSVSRKRNDSARGPRKASVRIKLSLQGKTDDLITICWTNTVAGVSLYHRGKFSPKLALVSPLGGPTEVGGV